MINDKDDKKDELDRIFREARKALEQRLHGADGEWIEDLTMHDEFIHYKELLAIGVLELGMINFIYRFYHTFGESE